MPVCLRWGVHGSFGTARRDILQLVGSVTERVSKILWDPITIKAFGTVVKVVVVVNADQIGSTVLDRISLNINMHRRMMLKD